MSNDFEEIDIDDMEYEERPKKKPKGKTKICKHCKEEINAKAKVCKYCKKKQESGCLVWIVAALFLLIFIPAIAGSGEKENQKQQVLNKSYVVGNSLTHEDITINYISADKYVSDNQFMQPTEGTEYYRVEFEFTNNGSSDLTISSMVNWNCYADGYLVNQTWINTDDDLSGTLSSGKKLKGALYFEIPLDAKSVELEYKNNIWLEDKIKFIVK